jgi:hypothetical protein
MVRVKYVEMPILLSETNEGVKTKNKADMEGQNISQVTFLSFDPQHNLPPPLKFAG